jgi:hypothetical protein
MQPSGSGAAKGQAQRPSICRAVVYNDHGHPTPEQWPAIVLRVNVDSSLMLTVFNSKGPMQVDHATEGSGVGQWQWPALTNVPQNQPAT